MKTQRLMNPNEPKVTAIQSRHHTSLELIAEYASLMSEGLQFDPCSAIETSDGHIFIWDGKHRLEAAIRNGSMLLCDLESGTEQDALWKACSANKKHGLKRSNADIQKAVQEAVKLRPEKSDREIGNWVGCDHKTVGKYRKEMEASGELPQIQTRTVSRGGQEYQMEMPIHIEPVEMSEITQPVSHFSGFVPADMQISTQKSLAFKPRQEQGAQEKTTSERIRKYLVEMCEGLTPEETLYRLYIIACQRMGYEKYIEQIREGANEEKYRPILEACENLLKERQKEWNIKLFTIPANDRAYKCARCQKDILGGLMFHYTAKKEYVCVICADKVKCDFCGRCFDKEQMTEHNGQTVDTECYYKILKAEEETERIRAAHEKVGISDPESPQKDSIDILKCDFCLEQYPAAQIYLGDIGVAICCKCAAKAQIALLHPNDPDVIAEFQQFKQECIHDFQARRTRDLDKILLTETLKILYISEQEKIIKQYTRANSTTAEVDEITWGSWKVFERFDTKKAMMERVKELEQEPDVIFDGRL